MALSIRLQDQLPDLWGPLFKNYIFKKGNRALNHVLGPSGQSLCDCPGDSPTEGATRATMLPPPPLLQGVTA